MVFDERSVQQSRGNQNRQSNTAQEQFYNVAPPEKLQGAVVGPARQPAKKNATRVNAPELPTSDKSVASLRAEGYSEIPPACRKPQLDGDAAGYEKCMLNYVLSMGR